LAATRAQCLKSLRWHAVQRKHWHDEHDLICFDVIFLLFETFGRDPG
jgi:hypothetical protein